MKKILFGMITASLLIGCGEPEHKDKDKIPAPDASNSQNDNPVIEGEAEFQPDSYWLADNGWHFSLVTKDNSTLLIRNEAVAQIINGHLLWIFDNGGHEGYTQNFSVSCEGGKCQLSFSRFMAEWDASMATDFQSLELTPVANSWGFPNTTVATVFSDFPSGKYYRGDLSVFKPAAAGNLPVGLQIDANLIVSTDEWDQGFNFIEKLDDETYLVYAQSATETPFPSSESQRNWFTLFKLEAGERSACGACQCTEYTWKIGDKWNNYRDLVKNDPTFNQYQGIVHYVEPGSCPAALTMPFDQITVQDSVKGNWDWVVTGSTVTPYDDSRSLNYVEVLEQGIDSYLVAYTYGMVFNWDTSDPNRFEYERYYHLAKFTKAANDCYQIAVSDLSTSGTFGLDYSMEMPLKFTACNPIIIEKPNPDNPGDITDNPGDSTDNPGDGTDVDPNPDFILAEKFSGASKIGGEEWVLTKDGSMLTGNFNGDTVNLQILSVEDGATTTTSHAHFLLVKALAGHQWMNLSVGSITAIKLYFYETETPYFYFMYADPLPTLSASSTDLSDLSYLKLKKTFYLQ